jgi:antitoxin component YwqK of YwqJK toxin-antitoxin module
MRKKNSNTVIQIIAAAFWTTGIFASCQSKKEMAAKHVLSTDIAMLDSLKQSSDSSYTKPYFTREFVTATYFVNKKDTSIVQVMKDKDSVIRQVITTKNKTRMFTAQYYSNGQLMAKYELDKFGQYNGYSEEYYESGFVK